MKKKLIIYLASASFVSFSVIFSLWLGLSLTKLSDMSRSIMLIFVTCIILPVICMALWRRFYQIDINNHPDGSY